MDHCLKHLYQFESLIGILLLLDIWKLILYLITEAILAVNLLAPWIWWRYSQAGLNKPFLWAKVKLQQLTQWMISRKNCRFGWIVMAVLNLSIGIWLDTAKRKNCFLPDQDQIGKMIMPM